MKEWRIIGVQVKAHLHSLLFNWITKHDPFDTLQNAVDVAHFLTALCC